MFTKGQWITLVVIAVAVLLMVVGCAPSPTPVPSSAIVLAAAKTFNAGDLEGSLAYYADDAAMKLIGVPPDEPDSYQGKDALRAAFKGWAQVHFQLQVEVVKVEGDTITTRTQTWMDATRALGVAPLVATEVYVVKDGKIKSETYTITPESAAKLQAAVAKAQAAVQPAPTAIPLPTPGLATTPFPIGVFVDANGSTIEHRADGTLSARSAVANDDALYKVTGDQIVYSGGGCVALGAGDGVYQWAYDGKVLTFKALAADSCGARAAFLRASFTKKQ